MSMTCGMCQTEIKTSKPIFIFTDTLFQENGRWIDHLTTESFCSTDCLIECFQDEGEWICAEEGQVDDEGVECCRCDNKTQAGHILSMGWKKTKRERWHKLVTSRNYCSTLCFTQDLEDKESPVFMSLPKKPRKKRKSKKAKKN